MRSCSEPAHQGRLEAGLFVEFAVGGVLKVFVGAHETATDALATTIWHERYVGSVSPSLVAAASASRPDLYLLTGDEIAFVQDGMRDGEHLRAAMQERFRHVVAASGVPWLEVRGSRDERQTAAAQAVDAVMARGWDLADPLG